MDSEKPAAQFDLSGKVVLISGGTGFLGAHFARALAGANACVVAVDTRSPHVLRHDQPDWYKKLIVT